MPLHGPGERITKYTEKLIPARVAEDLTTMKPAMVASETVIFNELASVEDRVKGILSGEAVNSILYPAYMAFAKEVWAKERNFGGGTALINEVSLMVYKWKTRGLSEPVLDKIRTEVFGLPAPGAP